MVLTAWQRMRSWSDHPSIKRIAAWVVLAGLAGHLVNFVIQYGHNLPANDEWAFVPVYFDTASAKWDWLFERHSEHRYPLARGIFLGLLWLTNSDFRAGMVVSSGLLVGSAALLIVAARRVRSSSIRGSEASWSDCWFPLLLLHRGHCENVLMGYQIAFTLTVFAVSLAIFTAVKSVSWPRDRTTGVALFAVVVVAFGGGVGFVFAPPLVAWLIYHLATKAPVRLHVVDGVAALTILSVTAWLSWTAWDTFRNPSAARNPFGETLHVVNEAAAMAIGPMSLFRANWYGSPVLAAAVVTGCALVWQIRRGRESRSVPLGLLAVLLGTLGFLAAIGVTRPSGFAPRFAAITCLLPALAVLTAAGWLPRFRRDSTMSLLFVAVGGLLLVRGNDEAGGRYALPYHRSFELVEADIRAGVPLNLFADRHTLYWSTGFPQFWPTLRDHGHTVARDIAPPRNFATAPVKLIPTVAAPALLPPVEPGRVRLVLPRCPAPHVMAVRFRFRTAQLTYWETFTIQWVGRTPDGREVAKSDVVALWALPGESTVTAWIDGPFLGGAVDCGWPGRTVEILSAEWLLPAANP